MPIQALVPFLDYLLSLRLKKESAYGFCMKRLFAALSGIIGFIFVVVTAMANQSKKDAVENLQTWLEWAPEWAANPLISGALAFGFIVFSVFLLIWKEKPKKKQLLPIEITNTNKMITLSGGLGGQSIPLEISLENTCNDEQKRPKL